MLLYVFVLISCDSYFWERFEHLQQAELDRRLFRLFSMFEDAVVGCGWASVKPCELLWTMAEWGKHRKTMEHLSTSNLLGKNHQLHPAASKMPWSPASSRQNDLGHRVKRIFGPSPSSALRHFLQPHFQNVSSTRIVMSWKCWHS